MPYPYSIENLPITRKRILDRPRNICAAVAASLLALTCSYMFAASPIFHKPPNAIAILVSLIAVLIPSLMAVGFELAKVVMTIDKDGFTYYAESERQIYKWNEIESVHEDVSSTRGTRSKVLKIVRKGQKLKDVRKSINDVFDLDQKTLGRFLVTCVEHFGDSQRPPDQPPPRL